MNFYPHHIGDYLTATAHLTWLEDAAYRRLLDVYYSREAKIPLDVGQACRLVRAASKGEKQAVETVLKEFFTQTEEGWSHTRCDAEIAKARALAERAKTNGMKGGRPVKQKPKITQPVFLGSDSETQKKPTHKAPNPNPITNISSVSNDTGEKPPSSANPEEIIFGYGVPMLTNAGTPEKQARAFLGRLRHIHGDLALVDKLRECIKADPIQPLTWLAAALPPNGAAPKRAAHSGFDKLNYSEGINADGTFS